MRSLSRRVLTLLQFTRFALVFTAIGDGQASLLLAAASSATESQPWYRQLDPLAMLWMLLASIGLYSFGMCLNDIIDRRRDALLAADRPLPSGRIGVGAAHVVAALLLLLAIFGGAMLAVHVDRTVLTLTLLAGVIGLIFFYDFAGKYLVPLGLISLGLIRFFHAAIAAPNLPVPWHPLFLLNHVAILSMLSYAWEQKRPILSKRHIVMVSVGLFLLNAAIIGMLFVRRTTPAQWMDDLRVTPAIAWPIVAAVLFGWVATVIFQRAPDSRAGGKTVMLVGLLWLIVYDAAFVIGYVHWLPALCLLLLLPIAWLGVRVTRAWARLSELSEKPEYIRAR